MAVGGVGRTGTLDVADDASGRVVHEFDAHLCDTTTGTWQCQQMPHPLNIPPRNEEIVVVEMERFDVPVRPRTRVTLTSLTGTFDESMIAVVECDICGFDPGSGVLEAGYDDGGFRGVDVEDGLLHSLTFRPQRKLRGQGLMRLEPYWL